MTVSIIFREKADRGVALDAASSFDAYLCSEEETSAPAEV